MAIKYTHTNIISKDWKKLVKFYQEVLECMPAPPERDLAGTWLDEGTGVKNAHLMGMHLRLPGLGENGPTLEIYQYSNNVEKPQSVANTEGIGHLAFHVDDVKEIHDKILSYGGNELGKITEKEIEGVGMLTFVYMTDPEGNIIELQNWK